MILKVYNYPYTGIENFFMINDVDVENIPNKYLASISLDFSNKNVNVYSIRDIDSKRYLEERSQDQLESYLSSRFDLLFLRYKGVSAISSLNLL